LFWHFFLDENFNHPQAGIAHGMLLLCRTDTGIITYGIHGPDASES
jgi:hypothetical protein